jgi:hypothetical protein
MRNGWAIQTTITRNHPAQRSLSFGPRGRTTLAGLELSGTAEAIMMAGYVIFIALAAIA